MEIRWGDFYFQAERTVAILLALAPIMFVMTIPKVLNGIKTIVYLLRRGARRRLSPQERIDASVR